MAYMIKTVKVDNLSQNATNYNADSRTFTFDFGDFQIQNWLVGVTYFHFGYDSGENTTVKEIALLELNDTNQSNPSKVIITPEIKFENGSKDVNYYRSALYLVCIATDDSSSVAFGNVAGDTTSGETSDLVDISTLTATDISPLLTGFKVTQSSSREVRSFKAAVGWAGPPNNGSTQGAATSDAQLRSDTHLEDVAFTQAAYLLTDQQTITAKQICMQTNSTQTITAPTNLTSWGVFIQSSQAQTGSEHHINAITGGVKATLSEGKFQIAQCSSAISGNGGNNDSMSYCTALIVSVLDDTAS